MTDFLHDAEYRTESWKRRHSPEAIAQMGAWRWKGIQQYATRILRMISGSGFLHGDTKRVIDFGGADGPLGFGSIVVDQKAEYKTLADVSGKVDVIFTSHTLEHLDDPLEWLQQAYKRLEEGGYLIAHVPAWTCERWRAGQYKNPFQREEHKYTFGLGEPNTTPINKIILDSGFDIELAEYVGDDSILVIARKP